MPCSQRGPAATVNIQMPVQLPGMPGAPRKVSQSCKSDQKADVTITWNAASGATSYKVYHTSGYMYGTTSSTQFKVRDADARWDGYFTCYVEACNSAGCTKGPQGTIQVTRCAAQCPTPPSPTPIRSYFQGLGCVVEYLGGTPRRVKVYYGGKSYTFTEGSNCYYIGDVLYTSPSTALSAARSLGACV